MTACMVSIWESPVRTTRAAQQATGGGRIGEGGARLGYQAAAGQLCVTKNRPEGRIETARCQDQVPRTALIAILEGLAPQGRGGWDVQVAQRMAPSHVECPDPSSRRV